MSEADTAADNAAGTAAAGVRLEHPEPGIALLRLARPQNLNALGDDTVAAIARLLDGIGADPAVRALILTGEGKGFCAGFDLGLAADAPGSAELGETAAWMRRQEAFAALVTRLRALPQPVIAAVNGPANGAGWAWRWRRKSASRAVPPSSTRPSCAWACPAATLA
jgi:enoyl-CoA hydratase